MTNDPLMLEDQQPPNKPDKYQRWTATDIRILMALSSLTFVMFFVNRSFFFIFLSGTVLNLIYPPARFLSRGNPLLDRVIFDLATVLVALSALMSLRAVIGTTFLFFVFSCSVSIAPFCQRQFTDFFNIVTKRDLQARSWSFRFTRVVAVLNVVLVLWMLGLRLPGWLFAPQAFAFTLTLITWSRSASPSAEIQKDEENLDPLPPVEDSAPTPPNLEGGETDS